MPRKHGDAPGGDFILVSLGYYILGIMSSTNCEIAVNFLIYTENDNGFWGIYSQGGAMRGAGR